MIMLDQGAGTLTLPLPIVFGVSAAVVILLIVSLFRSGGRGFQSFVSLSILGVIAVGGWHVVSAMGEMNAASRRAALETRAGQVAGMGGASHLMLACLDGIASEPIVSGCENAVFGGPESVAAALSYTAARLSLLTDAQEAANELRQREPSAVAQVRHALEQDPFGVLAHLLASRDQCTKEQCDAFALLKDSSRVQANMQRRAFEDVLARHSAGWGASEPKSPSLTAAPTTGSTEAAPAPASSRLNFPSASSIPPVSIMAAEPTTPPAAAPQPRPAQRPQTQRQRPSERTGPMPLQSAPQADQPRSQ